MKNKTYCAALVIFVGAMMVSCGQRDSMARTQVSICLADDQGMTDFIDSMRHFGQEEHLIFVDRTTDPNSKAFALKVDPTFGTGRRLVFFNLENTSEDRGITVGNVGLSEFQVALAVVRRKDHDGEAFAARLLDTFLAKWHSTSAEPSALPVENCGKLPRVD